MTQVNPELPKQMAQNVIPWPQWQHHGQQSVPFNVFKGKKQIVDTAIKPVDNFI